MEDISEPLRRDLLDHLLRPSGERAAFLKQLYERNRGMADILAELEADDDLRTRVEIELLRAHGDGGSPSAR